jgi:hypothetical protein
MRNSRLGMAVCVLIGLGALFLTASADNGGDAVISLGVTPLPPDCVQNPGGTATISWSIQHQTVPDHVMFHLYDPTHTIIYDQENYPGATGISITRTWTVPSVLPQGVYWVRVEYYAQGIGLEAWAETGFLVCQATNRICLQKRADENCDGLLSPDDPPVEGWTVGLLTPAGEELLMPTGADGWACWSGLPLGDYTAFEVVQPGWIPVLPDSVEVTLGETPIEIVFLNMSYELCYKVCCLEHACIITTQIECERLSGYWHPEWTTCEPNPCDIYTPTEKATWGQIKRILK